MYGIACFWKSEDSLPSPTRVLESNSGGQQVWREAPLLRHLVDPDWFVKITTLDFPSTTSILCVFYSNP